MNEEVTSICNVKDAIKHLARVDESLTFTLLCEKFASMLLGGGTTLQYALSQLYREKVIALFEKPREIA
jgi:hypothetical protein